MPRTHLTGSDPGLPPAVDLAGQLLAGRYRIVRRAAAGGMSVVYLGLDTRNGDEPVAIKVAAAAACAARLGREARILRRLHAPLFPRVVEDGRLPDGRPFVVLEWLEGETLAARLARAPADPADILDVADEIAIALEQAHAAGIVHRDLKPENVFLCADGRVTLLDLGVALVAGEVRLTEPGDRPGTRAFMAPEQVLAPHLIDARADLYGLAMLLRAALGGDGALPVITSLEPERYLEAIAARPPLDRCLSHVPRPVRALIARAESPAASARFASMADFRGALALAADALEAEADGNDDDDDADGAGEGADAGDDLDVDGDDDVDAEADDDSIPSTPAAPAQPPDLPAPVSTDDRRSPAQRRRPGRRSRRITAAAAAAVVLLSGAGLTIRLLSQGRRSPGVESRTAGSQLGADPSPGLPALTSPAPIDPKRQETGADDPPFLKLVR